MGHKCNLMVPFPDYRLETDAFWRGSAGNVPDPPFVNEALANGSRIDLDHAASRTYVRLIVEANGGNSFKQDYRTCGAVE